MESDKIYTEILFHVGNDGKFQKIFNYLFNFVLVIFGTMASLNIVLALAVPDHWCYVPGRNVTNYTLEEWKNINIPRENGSFGSKVYKKCAMFEGGQEIQECLYGWEYDKTWYTETIASKENWVCNDNLKITNSFLVARFGEISGTFLFGQLGDRFGRKPVYFMSLISLFVGRVLGIFATSIYWLFLVSFSIGNLSALSLYQSPLIIGIEISKDEDRSFISFLQTVGWSAGLCVLPFIYWASGSWYYFMLITTLPIILFVFLGRFIVESPRWLASTGKTKRCYRELKKIADVNKCIIPDSCLIELRKLTEGDKNGSPGLWKLFSNWTIARITLVSMSGWAGYMLIYLALTLNATNLAGNPFLNFFLQSLAELPGYWLGKVLCDSCGRKLTRTGSFFIICVGCLLLMYFVQDPKYAMVVSVISSLIKTTLSLTFYAINLQSLELFPTNLRQTGTSICINVGFLSALASPYIVYLGTSINASYPYIVLTLVATASGILSVFVPETKNRELPETIDEVINFVEKEKFWSFSIKSYDECSKVDAAEKK